MILIVEDEAAHVELIRRAFEDADDSIEIAFASSIARAVEIILHNIPALVIIDLLLPDGRGTDLIPEDRENAAFPVVVMTSHGDEQVAVEAMKAGALDYIVKSPLAFTQLPRTALRSIREWGHIQARRAAEESVRESEARLRAFLDAAAQGVIVADQQHAIQYVNHQMAVMFGYHQQELLAQNAALLFDELHSQHQQYKQLIQQYIREPGDNPIRLGVEMLGRRKNGELFPVSLSLNQMEFKGEVQIIALVADVSQQKALEAQAAEAARMELALQQEKQLRHHKDHFLSMISHEFRTPLAVIRSSNDILKKHYARLPEEKRQQNFHRIEAKVQEMDNMISDILLLSKSEMRLLEFRPQLTSLPPFLQEIVENVQNRHRQSRVSVQLQASDTHYNIDQYLLHHALTNLLDNALKYSPAESPVRMEVRNGEGLLLIDIIDQGIGIAQEELEAMFKAFHRGSNVGRIEGTGVGLALVKEFIGLHGGSLHCHSQLGDGTCFRVTLPV